MGCWFCSTSEHVTSQQHTQWLSDKPFLHAAPAPGTARLAWSFTLLSSNGTQVGNASTPNSAASITGNGLAASPHKAVLALPDDVLRSGGLFRLRLTATYLSATLIEGDVKDSSTTQASPEFGLGKCTAAWGLRLAAAALPGHEHNVTAAHSSCCPFLPLQASRLLQPSPALPVVRRR